MQVLASTPTVVNRRLKAALHWDGDDMRNKRHIRVVELKNNKLHTFKGMLGYCSKDRNEDWFQCSFSGVTQAHVRAIWVGLSPRRDMTTSTSGNRCIFMLPFNQCNCLKQFCVHSLQMCL